MLNSELSLGPDERVIFEKVTTQDLHAHLMDRRKEVIRRTIIAGGFQVAVIVLLFGLTMLYDPYSGASRLLVVIYLTIVIWAIFLVTSFGQIQDIFNRFFRVFSKEELKEYKAIVRITNLRIILKGKKEFYKKVQNLPPGVVIKQKDTIIASRESLASIEVDARFYTFRINFCLREFSPEQRPRKHIARLNYEGEQFQACLNKVEEFAREISPPILLKHVDHPLMFFILFFALLLIIFSFYLISGI